MIQTVEDCPDKHGLPVHSWEKMLVLLKLSKEDSTYFHSKLDKAGVFYQLLNLSMLPHTVFDAAVNRFDKGAVV